MLSKIKTRFYDGNNHIIRNTVRWAGAQAKTGSHRISFEFPHFTGFLPRQQKILYSCHWTDINSFHRVLHPINYKLIYIYVNYLILLNKSTMSLFMLIVGG